MNPLDEQVRVVTAPAGSGKTTLLVQRYLRALHTSTADRIVAITFTRKAAAELRVRIADVLRAVVQPDSASPEMAQLYLAHAPPKQRALDALEALPAAPIGTVDAFIGDLLQEFLLHAGLPVTTGVAYLDGSSRGPGDASSAYRGAARAVLEELSPNARTLLAELTFGKAASDLAALAAWGVPDTCGLTELLDALGEAMRTSIASEPAWLAAKQDRWVSPALHQAVMAWIRAPYDRPPVGIFRWLARVSRDPRPLRAKVLDDTLRAVGLPSPGGAAAWAAWRGSQWQDDALLPRADAVREAFVTLAREVRDRALTEIARTAELDYDELLLAATTLCSSPPEALRERFDLLMVDELQDTNPGQLAFYEAFAAMRPGLSHFFVGDGRQAIYRFRHADPHGWQALVGRAKAAGTWAELQSNYRSSQRLVAAQRLLFTDLAEHEAGVEGLPTLAHGEDAALGALDEAVWSSPVAWVDAPLHDDASALGVAAFAQRVSARKPHLRGERSVVLTRSWAQAHKAARVLRAWGLRVQVAGDRTLLEGAVARDLGCWLGALVEPTADVALAGLLKHPAIGLTDRGLLWLRRGGGLGRILVPDVELAGLDADDTERARLAGALLREGRRSIGRRPTAQVLEAVVAELHWRPMIAAGPDGLRGVAELDLLLDHIRALEADRVDPGAVLEALQSGEAGTELPAVRMHADAGVVEVTTVFQAKGLEWDHVCIVGASALSGSAVQYGALVRTSRPRGVPMWGMKLDVEGGLHPSPSPVAVLQTALEGGEKRQEGLRLFYVALTRAKRSVTFALGKMVESGDCLTAAIREAMGKLPSELAHRVEPEQVEAREAPALERLPTGRDRPFEARWTDAPGWSVTQPSARRASAELLDAWRARGQVVLGDPAPGLPDPRGTYAEVSEATWGTLVHGWLEIWAFEGDPTLGAAERYLAQHAGVRDDELAAWLVELGRGLMGSLPGFADLVEAGVCHFELPVVGVDGDELLVGRADLVVELPGRRAVIIDFKAGTKAATAAWIPELTTYAGQLEGYRRVLESAGWTVDEVGLVYVRGVSWARLRVS